MLFLAHRSDLGGHRATGERAPNRKLHRSCACSVPDAGPGCPEGTWQLSVPGSERASASHLCADPVSSPGWDEPPGVSPCSGTATTSHHTAHSHAWGFVMLRFGFSVQDILMMLFNKLKC